MGNTAKCRQLAGEMPAVKSITAKVAKPTKKKRIPLPLFKTFALSALPAVKPITAKLAKTAKVNKRMCYQDVIQTPLRSLRSLQLH